MYISIKRHKLYFVFMSSLLLHTIWRAYENFIHKSFMTFSVLPLPRPKIFLFILLLLCLVCPSEVYEKAYLLYMCVQLSKKNPTWLAQLVIVHGTCTMALRLGTWVHQGASCCLTDERKAAVKWLDRSSATKMSCNSGRHFVHHFCRSSTSQWGKSACDRQVTNENRFFC